MDSTPQPAAPQATAHLDDSAARSRAIVLLVLGILVLGASIVGPVSLFMEGLHRSPDPVKRILVPMLLPTLTVLALIAGALWVRAFDQTVANRRHLRAVAWAASLYLAVFLAAQTVAAFWGLWGLSEQKGVQSVFAGWFMPGTIAIQTGVAALAFFSLRAWWRRVARAKAAAMTSAV